MTALHYDFDERLKSSEGVAVSEDVESILLNNLAGALSVTKAHEVNDRSGTDWWVECSGRKHLSVDAKVREEDWALRGQDDLALEVWSVCEKSIIGWTLDRNKQSDFILWFWKETKRWCILPFPMLCSVFSEHKDEWCEKYKTARQFTPRKSSGGGNYHSECVFVPRREIWARIYAMFAGQPK